MLASGTTFVKHPLIYRKNVMEGYLR